jgi:hypothetical protein
MFQSILHHHFLKIFFRLQFLSYLIFLLKLKKAL